VIEIGAQQLALTFLEARDRLKHFGLLFGAFLPCPLPAAAPTLVGEGGQEHLAADAPAAREFWTWLGFEYAAIDIDGSPGSIPIDLNYDSVPADKLGKSAHDKFRHDRTRRQPGGYWSVFRPNAFDDLPHSARKERPDRGDRT
jgi:hypothetical protein